MTQNRTDLLVDLRLLPAPPPVEAAVGHRRAHRLEERFAQRQHAVVEAPHGERRGVQQAVAVSGRGQRPQPLTRAQVRPPVEPP